MMKLMQLFLLLYSCFQVRGIVEPCPSKCICLSKVKVLCNGAELKTVPSDLPAEVEELSFSRNELDTLDQEMFHQWTQIKVLSLNSNKIKTLKPFIFKGMTNLKDLSIQNNPFTDLNQFSFAGIENVSQVDLRNNKIETIHPYAFAGSKNIAMLFLQGNPVVRIRSRAFSGIRNVQFLYLPSWIKVIESDAFYDAQGIGLLRLHSVSLYSLRPYTFRGLKNVTQISIQESDLGAIQTNSLVGLNNIGELRLINNKVDTLEGLIVRADSNVNGVVVKGNHFISIKNSPSAIDIQANERIVIVENFLPCDCSILSVLTSPSAMTIPLFSLHNYCVSPYDMYGKAIDVVNKTDMESCFRVSKFKESGSLVTSGGSTALWSLFLVYLVVLKHVLYTLFDK